MSYLKSGPAFRRRAPHFGLTLIELLVVIAIIGLLVAILLPAIQAARERARQVQCKNNLRQIALAVHNYHSAHDQLPAGAWLVDFRATVKGPLINQYSTTWFALIVPFMEQSETFQSWDLFAPWNAPQNEAARETPIPLFVCPTVGDIDLVRVPVPHHDSFGARGDYVGNSGTDQSAGVRPPWRQPHPADGVIMFARIEEALRLPRAPAIPWHSQVRFASITDGLSKTLMAGEQMAHPIGLADRIEYSIFDGYAWAWAALSDASRGMVSDYCGSIMCHRFGSWHPRICHFAMCDGSVRGISVNINQDLFNRLSSRNDEEPIDLSDF